MQFLRGEIDEPALLAAATDDNQRTEARCYLGVAHAAAGRPDQARPHFEWVRDRGTKSFKEYGMALAELRRLDAAPAK